MLIFTRIHSWVLSCYIQTEEWSSFNWFQIGCGGKKSSLIREGKILTLVNICMARCRYESQMVSVCIPARREDQYHLHGVKWWKGTASLLLASEECEKRLNLAWKGLIFKNLSKMYVLILVTQLILLPHSVWNIIHCCLNVLSWGRTFFLCDTSVWSGKF